MERIIKYLKEQGIVTLDPSYYRFIRLWMNWYKGRVPSIHNYTQYNGIKRIPRCRKTLGMAKKVCEDWANLLLNEKVEIKATDEAVDTAVKDVLEFNRFSVYANQLVEKAFAFGTGALVEYLDDDQVIIDYITANCIFPITWDNGDITECAFASERKEGKDTFVYLNIHRVNDAGNYTIENKMLRVGRARLEETALPDGLVDFYDTGSPVPRFQIIYPNIANNVDLSSPLGISVYANALDQIEAADVIFDAFYNEFNLGRKRVLVPMTMARTIMEKEGGGVVPVFDENDLVFYAYQTDDKTQRIAEMNGELRVDSLVKGINEAVNLVGYKCGFGDNKYEFNGSGVRSGAKTAREIISEDSDMFRAVRKHEAVLTAAITYMFRAVASMLGFATNFSVSVDYDDSIIEDTATEQARDRQDVVDGIMSRLEYRMKWYHEDEATAAKKLQGLAENDAVMGFA